MNPFSKLFLLYYIPLTTELIAMILHELTQRVSGIDFRSRANKVANLFHELLVRSVLVKSTKIAYLCCMNILIRYCKRLLVGGTRVHSKERHPFL